MSGGGGRTSTEKDVRMGAQPSLTENVAGSGEDELREGDCATEGWNGEERRDGEDRKRKRKRNRERSYRSKEEKGEEEREGRTVNGESAKGAAFN